eukprot:GSChrysophyteH1.ASY1.ANO1.618.1 assembled CDS
MGWFAKLIALCISIVVFFIAYRSGFNGEVSVVCTNRSHDKATNLRSAQSEEAPCPEGSASRPSEHAAQKLVRRGDKKIECPVYKNYGNFSLFKNIWPINRKANLDNFRSTSVLRQVFSSLHHPDTPAKAEFILASSGTFKGLQGGSEVDGGVSKRIHSGNIPLAGIDGEYPFRNCKEVYLTRSGSRGNMPNKCVAVTMLSPGKPVQHHSPYYHSHRIGYQAKMTNQYANDWVTSRELQREGKFIEPLLKGLDVLVRQITAAIGEPRNADGSRRTAIVMVANEGVLDLVLNFICSCREGAANVDLSTVVVFLGQPEYAPLIESMGAKAIYHPFYGSIPKHAAGNYGDDVFARMMWLKTTSVYVTQQAGFDVIFQDADLVWLDDPIPFLQQQKGDVAFMDDGARSTRFTPYFVNSGFYYFKRSSATDYFVEALLKSGASEIDVTHSHQGVLLRHMIEAHDAAGLRVDILPNFDYPSGALYHHNKTFIKQIQNYEVFPKVFHMCWTSSRTDKVAYFKELGLWFLPIDDNVLKSASTTDTEGRRPDTNSLQYQCENPEAMLSWVISEKNQGKNADIRDKCCQIGGYFRDMKGHMRNKKQ